MWTETLATIGRRFEAESARFPEVRHFLTLQSDHDGDFHNPWTTGTEGQVAVVEGDLKHRVSVWCICAVLSQPQGDMQDVFQLRHGFFVPETPIAVELRAIRSLQVLAQAAWQCLPSRVRSSLDSPPYLATKGVSSAEHCWMLGLYSLAWRGDASIGLKADRNTHTKQRSANIESLFHRPDAERAKLARFFSMDPEWPPKYLYAFLQPDVFLASKLAVDALLREATSGDKHVARGVAKEKSPQVGGSLDPAIAMTTAVLVADVARAAGMRADALLERLRDRRYPIGGPKGAYVVELEQAIVALPVGKRRQVRAWAKLQGLGEQP